jgi:hypothetical protein
LTWQTVLQSNYTFAENPSSTAKYLPVQLNDVYIRDHDTGLLVKEGVYNNRTRMTMNVTSNDCSCDYLLEEVEYKFILDSNLAQISSIYVDLVLGKNIRGKCNNKLFLTQSVSVKWLNSLRVSSFNDS